MRRWIRRGLQVTGLMVVLAAILGTASLLGWGMALVVAGM